MHGMQMPVWNESGRRTPQLSKHHLSVPTSELELHWQVEAVNEGTLSDSAEERPLIVASVTLMQPDLVRHFFGY
jgi:hypothetical protein